MFVGAPDGKHEDIAKRLLEFGIAEKHLKVRGYVKTREALKRLFHEVDIVLMPSRTEGFGLTGLEALSAGLPVIVSKNSGFGEALSDAPFGFSFVIDSEDPNAWSAALKDIWNKKRQTRLYEAKVLRDSYGTRYGWPEQCEDLVKKMINSVNDAPCDPQMSSEAQGTLTRKSREDRKDVSAKEQTQILFTSESFPSSSVASLRTEDASCEPQMPSQAQGKLKRKSGGKKRKLCLPVTEECYDTPPKLLVKLPTLSDLRIAGKPWGNADLPIDVLLLTVEDCEFLSCFSFLDRPFKSYKKEVGPIYFGYIGNNGDQEKLKVALIKCSKGAADPGGSLTAVKNAVRVLSPKAVFSVGTCSGLSSDKVKLGDVVVSAKLTTAAGLIVPEGRHMSNLVRYAPYGWVAPLENPAELKVKVHCNGDILSQTQAARCGYADLRLQYPEAIAVETEGEGVFAAAYDEKIEWVVVKGVARFVNQTELSRSEWMSFASTMAASVVAKMLNDPVVFQEWPHCNQDASCEPQMPSDAQGKLKRKCDISFTDHGQKKAREEEKESKEHADSSSSQSHITEWIRQIYQKREGVVFPVPWCEGFSFQLENIFTRLKIVAKEKTRGTLTKEITNMTSIFTSHEDCQHPRIVLIEGEPGMGKTTYCQKLAYDWATKQDREWDESFPRVEVLLLLRCSEIESSIWEAMDDQILPEEIDPELKETFSRFVRREFHGKSVH
ncbi:uncharacterized protein [Montipora capricornis]|uniref:uncharacterized protein n=1 Tax=Montipora capricornis TaxID=246305 RepID=UPI0035F1B7F0